MRQVVMRAMSALLAGALIAALPVLAGPATADDSPYPVDICATLQISTTVPQPGEDVTVSGVNFNSNADVNLVLKPVRNTLTKQQYDMGTVRTNGRGEFSTVIRMPERAQGTYDLHATTGAPTGSTCPVDPSQRLTIGGESSHRDHMTDGGPDRTAFTGLNILLLIIAAAVLIGIGIYATRRGRERTGTTV